MAKAIEATIVRGAIVLVLRAADGALTTNEIADAETSRQRHRAEHRSRRSEVVPG